MNRSTIVISAAVLVAAFTLAGCAPQGGAGKNSEHTSTSSGTSESGAPAKNADKPDNDLAKQSNKGDAAKPADEQKPEQEQEQPTDLHPQAPDEQSQVPTNKGDLASGFLAELNDTYVGQDAFETAMAIGNRGDVQQIRFLKQGESDFTLELMPEGYKVTSIFGGPELLVIEMSK